MNWLKPKIRKGLWTAALVVVASYLISFAILAHGGGYRWARSGRFRLAILASTDILVWQPRFGTFYAFRNISGENTYQSDFTGCFYSPLILLYQSWIAPSVRTVEADGSMPPAPRSLPARWQLHPEELRELPEAERTLGFTWEQFRERFAKGE